MFIVPYLGATCKTLIRIGTEARGRAHPRVSTGRDKCNGQISPLCGVQGAVIVRPTPAAGRPCPAQVPVEFAG